MINPNPKSLDENTVQYFVKMNNIEHINKLIRKIKNDIKSLHDGSKKEYKKDILAQWRYIRWMVFKNNEDREKVIFT